MQKQNTKTTRGTEAVKYVKAREILESGSAMGKRKQNGSRSDARKPKRFAEAEVDAKCRSDTRKYAEAPAMRKAEAETKAEGIRGARSIRKSGSGSRSDM